eukprot:2220262-Amphidinium_carterae.1
MLHQGVAYYCSTIEDLKYLMIAKTHASDENDKHYKEMTKLLKENDENDRMFWDRVIELLGLVEETKTCKKPTMARRMR